MATKPPDFDEREARCRELGLHTKFPKQLAVLRRMMLAKRARILDELQDRANIFADVIAIRETLARYLSGPALNDCMAAVRAKHIPEHLRGLRTKRQRLAERLAVVNDELLFRQESWVQRLPIGTIYYIDLDSGNDANDGLSTGQAWLTVQKYTTLTVRSAGDIAKVRANTDQVISANVLFDEDGSKDAYITIKGCDSTDDPWGDASDVRPVWDFTGTYRFDINTDNYWKFENLELTGADTLWATPLKITSSIGCLVEDCKIHDNSMGVELTYKTWAEIRNCEIADNARYALSVGTVTVLYLEGGTLEGDPGGGNDLAMYIQLGGVAFVRNVAIGTTVGFSSNKIKVPLFGLLHMVGCTGQANVRDTAHSQAGFIEDRLGVLGDQYTAHCAQIASDDAVVRTGGANHSLKITPLPSCGANSRATLRGRYSWTEGDFRIWCPSGSHTFSVWMYADSWTTLPTAAQLYVEASYIDSGSGASRSLQKSTAVLSANGVWEAVPVTVNPQQDGWVLLNVSLGAYEDTTESIRVDPRIVVA